MSAVIYKLRDYQAKRAIERAHRELEKHMEEIARIPYRGQGIDGMKFEPSKDPA
jgi:hypothetical protein